MKNKIVAKSEISLSLLKLSLAYNVHFSYTFDLRPEEFNSDMRKYFRDL